MGESKHYTIDIVEFILGNKCLKYCYMIKHFMEKLSAECRNSFYKNQPLHFLTKAYILEGVVGKRSQCCSELRANA